MISKMNLFCGGDGDAVLVAGELEPAVHGLLVVLEARVVDGRVFTLVTRKSGKKMPLVNEQNREVHVN